MTTTEKILKSKVFKLQNLAGFQIETMEAMQICSIKFFEWMSVNGWEFVRVSNDEFAYVNSHTNTILVNGSDYHYRKLISEHGKQISDLYKMFDADEKVNL